MWPVRICEYKGSAYEPLTVFVQNAKVSVMGPGQLSQVMTTVSKFVENQFPIRITH